MSKATICKNYFTNPIFVCNDDYAQNYLEILKEIIPLREELKNKFTREIGEEIGIDYDQFLAWQEVMPIEESIKRCLVKYKSLSFDDIDFADSLE